MKVSARLPEGSAVFLVPSANAASRVARAVCVRSIRSSPYPWCPTPPRETRAADDNFAAGDATLRDDIAKLCPARMEHHAQDAVDAEPGMPEAGAVHKLDSMRPYLFSFPATLTVTE